MSMKTYEFDVMEQLSNETMTLIKYEEVNCKKNDAIHSWVNVTGLLKASAFFFVGVREQHQPKLSLRSRSR